MRKFILFFTTFTLLSTPLTSDLLDHLKKAENKLDIHSMRNIDFIYMINLDHRPEKFKQAAGALNQYGIYPYRFSAVAGWKLSIDDINDIGLKFEPSMRPLMSTTYRPEAEGVPSHEYMTEIGRTYFCHCMSKGAIGCAMSHISILQDAWDSGYETIWVLEDDTECLEDPNILSDYIDKLDALVGKDKWDVLLTDQDYRIGPNKYLLAYGAQKRPTIDCSPDNRFSYKYIVNEKVSPDFKRVSSRFGTHSMIIRRSGIQKLLEFSKKYALYLPYDLENYLPSDIMRYSTTTDIVTNLLGSISDIGQNQSNTK